MKPGLAHLLRDRHYRIYKPMKRKLVMGEPIIAFLLKQSTFPVKEGLFVLREIAPNESWTPQRHTFERLKDGE